MRKFRTLAWALSAALVLTGLTAGAADASPTIQVTGITVTASTPNDGLGGAVPTVLAAVGTPVTLTVTLTPAGATFNNDTSLSVSASLFSGSRPHGSFSPSTITFPGGVNSATFTVTYSAVDNGVIATVSGGKHKGSALTPGATDPFDVLKELVTFPTNDPGLSTGLSVGDANCTAATSESECGTVILTNGAKSSNGALSLGACTPDLGCTSGSEVVQFIADLGTNYTPDAPAELIIRCVKSLCKGKGVNNYTVKASFSATGPLNVILAPCVTKGVADDGNGNNYCVDYVQSHRDNAGDVLLYVLFVSDFRGST